MESNEEQILQSLRERTKETHASQRVTLLLVYGHKVKGELYHVGEKDITLRVTPWWRSLFGLGAIFFHCHPSKIVGYAAQFIDRSGSVLD